MKLSEKWPTLRPERRVLYLKAYLRSQKKKSERDLKKSERSKKLLELARREIEIRKHILENQELHNDLASQAQNN